jgi:hypothetical protein
LALAKLVETQAVLARAATPSGVQDSQHTKDAGRYDGGGDHWPAAFLVAGDKQTAAELGRMIANVGRDVLQ